MMTTTTMMMVILKYLNIEFYLQLNIEIYNVRDFTLCHVNKMFSNYSVCFVAL